MATTVSSHPDPKLLVSSTSEPSLANLHDHLDNLWISYLNYLDNYTSAQNLIQQHMSAGFLSLARANFNSRGGVRRYGRDYFHERAVASRRVKIAQNGDDGEGRLDVGIVRWNENLEESPSDEPSANDDEDIKHVEQKQQQQQPSPPITPAPEPSSAGTDASTKTDSINNPKSEPMDLSTDDLSNRDNTTKPKPETKTKTNVDPLRWFGILVPPELRKAQSSFVVAIEEAVGDAVNASKRMRELEVEIRRVRKEIRKAEKAGGGV